MKNKKGHVEELYEMRVLVFIEDLDEGCFHQVLLNGKQFKKEEVVDNDLKEGFTAVKLDVGDEKYDSDIFIGLKSINDESGIG